jgi:HNH endonuclease/helix-turn-helix protein
MKKKVYTTEERFWQKVLKTETCWLWTAYKKPDGHGTFNRGKRMALAHRYSYELHCGVIPHGMLVCHKCDVPSCVNPDHLFLGTPDDNVRDCIRKGRNNRTNPPSPSITLPPRKPTREERFWSSVEKTGPHWLWIGGGIRPNGTGIFWLTGRQRIPAHQFAYEMVNPPLSEVEVIEHTCGEPCCVNPQHLRVVDRFWSRVDKNGPMPSAYTQCSENCWLWTGCKDERPGKGYGEFRVNNKKTLTHRYSYLINVGAIPDGLLVCHRCDNPSCVRPEHLWLGTPKDNSQDCSKKGRKNTPKGEDSVSSKLTEVEVREIKETYAAGGITHRELAKRYGVSRPHIGDIINGSRWPHI